MDEEDIPPIYVRKGREPYSGMVLNSIFVILRRALVVMVTVGMVLIFLPFLL